MYVPVHNRVDDPQEAWAFVKAHPFAVLCVNGPDGPVIAHVPLVVRYDEATGTHELIGHVARANPFHAAVPVEGAPCVAVFRGPDAYISPSLYPSKQIHGKVVPTWAYLAAEARGHLVVEPDPSAMRAFLEPATQDMEAAAPKPWKVDDAPADYISSLERAIVGLKIRVSALIAKRKINQGKPEADYQSVQEAFAASAHTSHQILSHEMQKESQKT
ncbi:FMN-binding negative transcriptional regulator [Aquidulcibacter sp.]|jgi:transcriptional regulator|uniref:FMN-binding negative transcriptional regulator n=1 Tax=Aquidulcibacter sp. TaxID=2052990 RepID=UPI000BD9651D|nr:MAG: transcriptional regulator [Alphaproteobacteria bacterium PA1]